MNRLVAAPLILGAVLSAASLFLDHRNVRILLECFEFFRNIEDAAGVTPPSVFVRIWEDHQRRWPRRILSYTVVLQWTYGSVGLLFLFASFTVLYLGISCKNSA